MFGGLAGESPIGITLYTDSFIVKGTAMTRQRRITDILNQSDEPFVVLENVSIDEFGSHGSSQTAAYAQVNLGSVLFACADTPIEALPELRTPKVPEKALISVPPFKISGAIHLLPNPNLREQLRELTGRFVPVTDATYWSDVVGEPRTAVALVAFNHARAQILAPHKEVDPWTGLSTPAGEGAPDAGSTPSSTGWSW